MVNITQKVSTLPTDMKKFLGGMLLDDETLSQDEIKLINDGQQKLSHQLKTQIPSILGYTAGAAANTTFQQYGFGLGGPDGWVNFIPLENITYYDFAESDSVVKYRAFGGEYFAHQGGDKNAMRVDFLLTGPLKEVFMNWLRALRLLSRSQVRGKPLFHQDESYIFDPVNARGEGLWTWTNVERREVEIEGLEFNIFNDIIQDNDGTGVVLENLDILTSEEWKSMPEPNRINFIRNLTNDQWVDFQSVYDKQVRAIGPEIRKEYPARIATANVNPLTIEKTIYRDDVMTYANEQQYGTHGEAFYDLQRRGYFTWHYSYPIIIKNMIFNRMWLETVQFTHDSRDGIDAIRGHLLMRKYERPPRLRWSAGGFNVSNVLVKEQKVLSNTHEQDITTFDDTGNEKSKHSKTIQNKTTKKQLWAPDKKVWLWEEKRNNRPQVSEYLTGIGVGIAKAAIIFSKKPHMHLGIASAKVKNVKSIFTRVVV